MRAVELLDGNLATLTRLANAPRRDRGFTRAVYSYPAKFQAHLPAALIELFTRPGELVVDPYAGGGTTGLEAYLAGRPALLTDLNPLGCLIARVKTTPLRADDVRAGLSSALAARACRAILDEDDAACLGPHVAGEIAALAGGIDAGGAPAAIVDLLRLALVHTLKVVGRRDFAEDSVLPRFHRTVARLGAAVASLPAHGPRPRVVCASNHTLAAAAGAAALVVTSPPYKDLDVEYGLLQIQRRVLRRSKRSHAVFALLGVAPLAKPVLCGGRGDAYWKGLAPALAAVRRVLADGAPAFFWIGFKTDDDHQRFVGALAAARLPVRHSIEVTLGRDRVASSRSTHHGRATGMLGQDLLLACLAD